MNTPDTYSITDHPHVWLWNKIRFRFNEFDDDRVWGQSFDSLRAPLDTQLWDQLASHIRLQLEEDHGIS